MAGRPRSLTFPNLLPAFVLLLGMFGCSASQPPTPPPAPVITAAPTPPKPRPLFPPSTESTQPAIVFPTAGNPIMLGIDVLEADDFAAVRGKRIGLLTHPGGVNRRGVSTIDVLRRAKQTKLVALFAPEHGLYGTEKASANIADTVDRRTGLPVYSLHGQNR